MVSPLLLVLDYKEHKKQIAKVRKRRLQREWAKANFEKVAISKKNYELSRRS